MTSDEINRKGAELFGDDFFVSRQQVDHYRKTRNHDIQELIKQSENSALNTGLARKADRVVLLKRLAEKMSNDLFDDDLLWTDQIKGIGSRDDFQVVEYEEFNTGEVAQLRGVLDDIAKEVGDRKNISEVTGKDGEQLIPDANYDRSISKLAETIGKSISNQS